MLGTKTSVVGELRTRDISREGMPEFLPAFKHSVPSNLYALNRADRALSYLLAKINSKT